MQVEILPLEVRAVIGKIKLSAPLYHSLRVGDIIVLDQSVESPLSLEVEQTPMGTATIGLLREKKAVKIETIHE